jgi:aspartate racemase
MQKVVGILGGMGPESTADLLIRIIRATPIEKEQDHLRIIIDNNPKIPNRTEVLLSGDTGSTITALTETARNLERAGAELIGMPCNTAHAFLAEIRASVGVPVLDMIDEAAKRAQESFGSSNVMGLLATDGSCRSRLYHGALSRHGIAVVTPRSDAQRSVMEVSTRVKNHGVSSGCLESLHPAIDDLTARGASVLIAGCTEISLVLADQPPRLPWLDPLQVLAERLIEEARNEPARRD